MGSWSLRFILWEKSLARPKSYLFMLMAAWCLSKVLIYQALYFSGAPKWHLSLISFLVQVFFLTLVAVRRFGRKLKQFFGRPEEWVSFLPCRQCLRCPLFWLQPRVEHIFAPILCSDCYCQKWPKTMGWIWREFLEHKFQPPISGFWKFSEMIWPVQWLLRVAES